MYYIIQTDYSLYGYGTSPELALMDANEWLDEPTTLDDLVSHCGNYRPQQVSGQMVITDDREHAEELLGGAI